jgi:ribosomal protein L12E/L44/L45/RPP1/RPP2
VWVDVPDRVLHLGQASSAVGVEVEKEWMAALVDHLESKAVSEPGLIERVAIGRD